MTISEVHGAIDIFAHNFTSCVRTFNHPDLFNRRSDRDGCDVGHLGPHKPLCSGVQQAGPATRLSGHGQDDDIRGRGIRKAKDLRPPGDTDRPGSWATVWWVKLAIDLLCGLWEIPEECCDLCYCSVYTFSNFPALTMHLCAVGLQ